MSRNRHNGQSVNPQQAAALLAQLFGMQLPGADGPAPVENATVAPTSTAKPKSSGKTSGPPPARSWTIDGHGVSDAGYPWIRFRTTTRAGRDFTPCVPADLVQFIKTT